MYAAHKGNYTTLCMFWTAADVFKLRIEQNRIEEARKILESLKRMLPRVEDVNKILDKKNAARTQTGQNSSASGRGEGNPVSTKSTEIKLPWKPEETPEPVSSAVGFIQYANRRLALASQIDSNKSNPADNSSISNNSANVVDSSNLNNSVEDSKPVDYSGHLTVSIDEGIVHPIEGVNALQSILLACLVSHPGFNVSQISDSTGIPSTVVETNLTHLLDKHLIEYRFNSKSDGYYLLHQ